MRARIFCLLITLFQGLAAADSYVIERRFGSSMDTEVEARPKWDLDYSRRLRGEIESDGYTRLRDQNGEVYRGYIERDDYGNLRDSDGNSIRIRPR